MRSKIVKALTKVVILGGMALAIATGMPGNTLEAEAATTTQLKEFRKELKTMMLTGDATAHDVEKYNMTYSESYSVWKDLVASDCKLAYNSGCLYESTTKNSSGKIKTYQVMGMDDGYLDRYENVCIWIKCFISMNIWLKMYIIRMRIAYLIQQVVHWA